VESLRNLLGDEWIKQEVLSADPEHLLGRWHKKNPDNPFTRYADDLAGFILKGGVKCDLARLATKLKSEFVETLVEMGYAVFLAKQGFQVTMEPTAPEAGPGLLAVRGSEYYVEVRKVGLDEASAAADLATQDVFNRLCSRPSRYGVLISMTDEYAAHSRQLKQAVNTVVTVLEDLTKRHVRKATLYYYGAGKHTLHEGDEAQPHFDYADGKKLAAQLEEFEHLKAAHFIARFDDSGNENDHTPVAVHPLGEHPYQVKPSETHLRLREILQKKSKQLPKASRGIIVLDITDLAKLMVDEETIMNAVYGDLQVIIKMPSDGEDFQWADMNRKTNGFFLKTTRVSAVVVETASIADDVFSVNREVFPTNNPQATVLTTEELKALGTIAEDLENLCAEKSITP